MSFFGKIGQAISGGIKSLTGGEGIGGLLKKGIGALVDKFAPKIADLLTNSPFANIANKVIGFAAEHGPKMAESGGFLGMVGGLLNKVGSLGSLANIAQTLLGKLGGPEALSKFGLENLANIFAQRQAQMMGPALLA
ncbi:MAG: hypothetical protein FJ137_06370 [Deltaproteobacteria bacterium]|nr:hypothetical protein [Deltaproteobacteria bacterium]